MYQWQHAEFIRSSDNLFRPVDMATAPDGTLFVVDTYRGIIQEGNWTRPGSYLRAKIDQYGLDKIVRHGRIWRLTYDGMARDRTVPRMHSETAAQLVAHLSHVNGWWRDTAQQLLILKQDRSVVPALQQLARNGRSADARVHALWTLEGLGAIDAALVRDLMKDPSPRMRIHAVRTSETLYKDGDKSLGNDYRALLKDADVNVVMQAMLTLNLFKVADIATLVKAAEEHMPARGVRELATRILTPPATGRGGGRGRSPEETAILERGETIYKELCMTCHGPDGLGTPKEGAPAGTTMAPALAGSRRVQDYRDYVIKALLHGVTGPVDGDTYSEVMVPMGTNKDDWIAAVASVRPYGVRQHRLDCQYDRRRARPARHGLETQAVDRGRAGRLAASPAACAADVDGHRESQLERRRVRAELHRLVHGRAAKARDVVPGRAARSDCARSKFNSRRRPADAAARQRERFRLAGGRCLAAHRRRRRRPRPPRLRRARRRRR